MCNGQGQDEDSQEAQSHDEEVEAFIVTAPYAISKEGTMVIEAVWKL
jgi:hypothetical protein